MSTQRWALRTEDTEIGLELTERGIGLSVRHPVKPGSWTTCQVPLSLPEKVELGGETERLRWEFAGADLEPGGRELTLHFQSRLLELISTWIARRGTGPVEHRMTLKNRSSQKLVLFQQESLEFGIQGEGTPILWRFHKESSDADPRGVYREILTRGAHLEAETNVRNDANTNGFIPLVFLDYAGEYGLYVGYEWPDGRIVAEVDGHAVIRVRAGLRDCFKTVIAPDAAFSVPPAYIGTYKGDVDRGGNGFKRWFLRYKMPAQMREDVTEPIFQIDDQGLAERMDLAACGVQAVKWDYGWWPGVYHTDAETAWMKTGEGIWRFGNPGLQQRLRALGITTMEEYGRYLKQHGLSWTLYVLFHDSLIDDPDTLSAKCHPEWFSETVITTGASADFGNEELVNWGKEKLTALLSENHVTTYRSDFEPICNTSDKRNRHVYPGVDTSYWCAVGFYDLIDHLRANVEGFRYECCGSGGSLKDFATLSHANVIQSNDNANYIDIRKTFYDSSYAIHPMQLQAPVNVDLFIGDPLDPDEAHYGWRSVIMGANNTASSVGDRQTALVPGTEETYLQHYAVLFRDKIRPLIRDANLYHILPRPDEVHWDGLEYFNPDTENDIKGAVFLFKPTGTEGPVKTVKLQGLDPNEYYRLEFEDRAEQNTVKTGAQLMEGLNVTISQTRGSEIIWIGEGKRPAGGGPGHSTIF